MAQLANLPAFPTLHNSPGAPPSSHSHTCPARPSRERCSLPLLSALGNSQPSFQMWGTFSLLYVFLPPPTSFPRFSVLLKQFLIVSKVMFNKVMVAKAAESWRRPGPCILTSVSFVPAAQSVLVLTGQSSQEASSPLSHLPRCS